MIPGVGGEFGVVVDEPATTESGPHRTAVVEDVVIECPVTIEVVGDGLGPQAYSALVEDVLGRIARAVGDV